MSGKIREIINEFKPFLGILNFTGSYGSLRLQRRMLLKCTCKNSNERPGLSSGCSEWDFSYGVDELPVCVYIGYLWSHNVWEYKALWVIQHIVGKKRL